MAWYERTPPMHPLLAKLLNSAVVGASRLARARFDVLARNPGEASQALLMRILKRQRDTEFARRRGFDAIWTVRDFQHALPIATYDDFRVDIERMARGERGVLTADPITSFALSSGTTGNEKLVPITTYTDRMIGQQFLLAQSTLYRDLPAARKGGPMVMLISAVMRGQTEGGFPTGALSAIAANGMLKSSRSTSLLSPSEVFLLRKQADAHYLHLLFALAEPSLHSINAPFASGLLDFFQLFEARWRSAVEDLARGTLSAEVALPPELEGPIRARLRPAPERARAVARELERGLDGIARRIWPELVYTSGITSGSFSIYAEKLRRYLGDLPIYSSSYAASEGILGMSSGLGEPTYILLPNAAFLEFIPADEVDSPSPSVRLIDELTEGQRYEVVVTTFGGLYRYRMGDVVEVVRHYKRVPVVEFLYRRGSLLNIGGEKTSEDAARKALTEALAKEGLEMMDFSAMEDVEQAPKRYVFFVELAASDKAVDVARIAEHLEEALRRANPFYLTLRARLGPLALYPVKPGTFQGLRDLMVRRGASPSQAKVPRLVPEGPLAEFLHEHRV